MALSKLRAVPQLILASASPRRKEILKAAGIRFDILPTSVAEQRKRGESPREFVSRLAAEKAEAALAHLPPSRVCPILGADTVVVMGRRIFGKPRSPQDARRMLRLLSGRQHQVLTGLCLLYPSIKKSSQRAEREIQWRKDVRVASTTIKFRRLTRQEIEEYVSTGEPLDKAGGYAIQGKASKYVEWVRGCYFNVVGLPVSLLWGMLKKLETRAGTERERFSSPESKKTSEDRSRMS